MVIKVENVVVDFAVLKGGMHPLISWDIVSNAIQFKVYRSSGGATPQNEYELVGVTNLNYFTDTSIELSRTHPVAYKVTWVNADNKESSLSEAITMPWYQAQSQVTTSKAFGGFRDRMFYSNIEHIRRMGWAVQNAGENVYVYIRNAVGQLCPYYDLDTQEHKAGRCKLCWGTSIIPGYTVFKTQAAFVDTPDLTDWTDRGISIESQVTARMTPYPWIKEGDFVRRQNGELGEVNNIKRNNWQTEVEFRWTVLSAHTVLHEMPIDDSQPYVIDLQIPQLTQKGWR